MLSVLTVRGEPDRGGESMRMGVRAARALTGLSLSVASRHVQSRLFRMALSRPSPNTHPYLTLAYQSPSQRWLVPWLASMVWGARAPLECHSFSALRPSSSALRVSTPERSRNHSQRTSHWNRSCFSPIATVARCARQQQPTTGAVHGKG